MCYALVDYVDSRREYELEEKKIYIFLVISAHFSFDRESPVCIRLGDGQPFLYEHFARNVCVYYVVWYGVVRIETLSGMSIKLMLRYHSVFHSFLHNFRFSSLSASLHRVLISLSCCLFFVFAQRGRRNEAIRSAKWTANIANIVEWEMNWRYGQQTTFDWIDEGDLCVLVHWRACESGISIW